MSTQAIKNKVTIVITEVKFLKVLNFFCKQQLNSKEDKNKRTYVDKSIVLKNKTKTFSHVKTIYYQEQEISKIEKSSYACKLFYITLHKEKNILCMHTSLFTDIRMWTPGKTLHYLAH